MGPSTQASPCPGLTRAPGSGLGGRPTALRAQEWVTGERVASPRGGCLPWGPMQQLADGCLTPGAWESGNLILEIPAPREERGREDGGSLAAPQQ